MALLKKVSIKGYRSIKEMELELRSLNILIGANGAGKSNFVSFFRMLNAMIEGRLQEYVGTTGRAESLLHFGPKVTPEIRTRLEFKGNPQISADQGIDAYAMRLAHAAGDTLVFAEETFLREDFLATNALGLGSGHQETHIGEAVEGRNQTAKVFRQLLNQCRVYHFHDTSSTARVRRFCYIDDNRWLLPDAGNLAALLYAYQHRSELVYRRIVSAIRKILPDFADFDLQPDLRNPREITLNWRTHRSDYLLGPHQLSDGTLRAMAIVTLLLQPDENMPGVIVLDEPELGLHPYALELVAGLIRAASVKAQVIVATQSQTFLEHFEPSEIVVVDSREGSSQFRRLDGEQLKDWLEDYTIGELWQRNVFGGGPLP